MTATTLTVVCIGLSILLLGWVAFLYFRPPSFDEEPLTEEELNHIVRRMGRTGDEN